MPLDAIPEDPFSKYNTDTSPILFNVIERKIAWEMSAGAYQRIDSHKAIVRIIKSDEDNRYRQHTLSVVGGGYRLVHNRELFGRVEDTMRKVIDARDLLDVRVTDRVSGWGRMCYRDYVFPSIRCIVGAHSRSTIAARMIVQNGYGGSALRVHAGAIDFYCTNGMIHGDYTTTYRKHTSGLTVDGIDKAVENALRSFDESKDKWRRWAETPVKHAAAMQLFKELANSAKLQENLADQYTRESDDRGANLWSVYSTLTYYASHRDGPFTLRSTVEQQDTVASTMLQRELNVSQWVKSPAWKALEHAS